MHLVYDDGAGERDVEVIATEPDLAVAELAVALGCPSGGALRVDGRTVEAGAAIAGAGFYEGATVTPAPARAGARRPPSRPARGDPSEPDAHPNRPVLAVTGGLDAGPSWPLASDATVVGRDPACDVVLRHPTVSSVHCRIDLRGDGAVAVSDLDSHNGTWRCDDAL